MRCRGFYLPCALAKKRKKKMEKKLYFAPESEAILIKTSGMMLVGSTLPDDQDPDIGGTGGGTPTDDPEDLA